MQVDSIIFDMDGTLWDNVDSYAIVWNIGLEKMGFDKRVTRDDLIGLMGKEARQLLDALIPEVNHETQDKLFETVIDEYEKLIPNIRPKIYPGVLEGLEALAKKHKLFLLSNCEEGGLVNFMCHTKTEHLFIDYKEHGQNLMPKHHNMKLLIDKHQLKSTVYVGDTDSDATQTEMAGLPFVYVSYGFGETNNYTLKFDNFEDLSKYFLNL